MAAPREVSKKLREVLGHEVGGSMTEWLDNLESRNEELRQETRADIAEVRLEIHALREEIRIGLSVGLAELREEMRVGFAKVDARFAGVDTKFAGVDTKFAGVDAKFAGVHAQFAGVDGRFASLESKFIAELQAVEKRTAQRIGALLMWATGAWIASMAVLLATFARR